ncbi:MAG: AAA family ATPase [Pseudomonadota bacterium]
MYTSFFGLNEKPFAITPDPRYLFMSERHGEGLAHLLYGVTDSGGFIQLTGEVGTGKTTLVRTLLGQLPNEVDVALILNPQVTVLEFLQAICRELGVALPADRDSPMALVDALNRFLLDAHARGRRIILLVDEAQNLSEEVLEQLRLLTNLETAKQKLLQIILIGQPELREILARNHLRQLAQRVTGRYHLEPLSRDEAAQYIEHRMRVAGAVGEIFDLGAKHEVHRIAGGIPRIMNVICDRALLGAFSQEQRLVDKRLVRGAAAEVAGDADIALGTATWKWAAAVAAIVIAASAAFGIATLQESNSGRPAIARIVDGASTAVSDNAEDANALAVGTELAMATPTEALPDAPEPVPSMEPASLLPALVSGELDSGMPAAMANLAALWDFEFDPSAGTACARASTEGLSCLYQRGSFGMLKKLDRPAVLTLTDDQGDTHYAVLAGLNNDGVTLRFGDFEETYPADEVMEIWYGQYMLLWRPPAGSPGSIRPGTRSAAVVWLRESLARLNGDAETVGAGDDFFDPDLEDRLRQFQRQQRLQVDGLAGEQTQIVINSALSPDATPTLSGDS